MRGSAAVARYSLAEVATYATAAPADSAYTTLLSVEGTPESQRVQASDPVAVANLRGNIHPDVATHRHSTLPGIVIPTYGGNVAFDGAGGDSPPARQHVEKCLQSLFGTDGANAFAGNTIASGGGAGVTAPLKLTDSTGLVATAGIYVAGEFAVVKEVDGQDVTLFHDLVGGIPADGTPVYGSRVYSPTMGDRAKYHYLNEERANGEGYTHGPGRFDTGGLSGLGAGGALKWNFTFLSNDWTDTPVNVASYPANEFTADPVVAAAGKVAINGVATCIADGSINFGIKHARVPCATGTNGFDGIELVAPVEPVINVSEYSSTTRMTQYRGRTGIPVLVGFSNGSTNATRARHSIAVFLPNAQVMTNPGAVADLRGLATQFVGRDPTPAQVAAGIDKSIYLYVFGGRA